ncbi:signal peptidase I [Trinickia dinghuensis]|uniref:Signal peptidase I n=1 Tax=Trinickia dinghuensis TaxID=2291023 RepID=A0A3D8JRW1_9BURK|nr:signal peptidase I [Trinickia dinghuensis]RDU95294.1 signal peptidase I [Trinickia dinghuensis]
MSKYFVNLWRSNKNLVAFLFLMVLFRSAIADWNVVPSGSMLPTIRIGDRIFVDKMAYDLRVPLTHISLVHLADPQRGDIVTIDSKAAHELLVKRVIGVPGDVIAMRDNVLYVNGAPADYRSLAKAPMRDALSGDAVYLAERFDGVSHVVRLSPMAPSPRSSFGPVTVPAGEYLMLGDNRDNSADSRYFGFIPRKEVMGRTRNVAFSLNPDRYYLPRFGRFGAALDQPLAANSATASNAASKAN